MQSSIIVKLLLLQIYLGKPHSWFLSSQLKWTWKCILYVWNSIEHVDLQRQMLGDLACLLELIV